jgi:hypothetical protein
MVQVKNRHKLSFSSNEVCVSGRGIITLNIQAMANITNGIKGVLETLLPH